MLKISHGQPAARGPHAALETLQCGPYIDSKKRYYGAKSIRSLEKIQILALKMAIFRKCGPRADLGWPWLLKIDILDDIFLILNHCDQPKID